MTVCSVAQIMPLSNVFEWMIELTALTRSQLGSSIAAALPAPTPRAGVPLEYAAFTMPGPPVARMMSASFMRRFVFGRLGASIQEMMSAGAPAATAASSTAFAAAIVQFFARGWGLMMMPFLVLSARSVLKIAVEVGFVVGMTAPMTPMGSATFMIPAASSSSTTPHVFVSLYVL